MIAVAERPSSQPSVTGESGIQSAATVLSGVVAGNIPEYPVRRIMVTGSRDWDNKQEIGRALFNYWYTAGCPKDIVLVHGAAKGADLLAASVWAGQGFHDEPHPADWDAYGKRAGILRNIEMLNTGPEHVLAFIKDNSRGASHAAAEAERRGIPVTYFREDTA